MYSYRNFLQGKYLGNKDVICLNITETTTIVYDQFLYFCVRTVPLAKEKK